MGDIGDIQINEKKKEENNQKFEKIEVEDENENATKLKIEEIKKEDNDEEEEISKSPKNNDSEKEKEEKTSGSKTEKEVLKTPRNKKMEDVKNEPSEEKERAQESTSKSPRNQGKPMENKIAEEMLEQKHLEINESEPVKKEVEEELKNEVQKTETILSSQTLKSSNPSISDELSAKSVTPREKQFPRNQSDILPSLREIPRDEDPSLMLFSHKGLPTRKYFKRRGTNSFISNHNEDNPLLVIDPLLTSPKIKRTPELTPKISQRVPKQSNEMNSIDVATPRSTLMNNPSITRNVLTGTGVISEDEFKFNRTVKRRDGNPLLGVGYEEPVVANNSKRVPPGGFSSGLW